MTFNLAKLPTGWLLTYYEVDDLNLAELSTEWLLTSLKDNF